MYIIEILQYLIWPAFIVLSWFAVRFALSVYEKKFPEKAELDGNRDEIVS
jgi:hypothetical protein